MNSGDKVTWKTRNRFKTMAYRTEGIVDYVQGTKVRIIIPWTKNGPKGETRIWKNVVDVEVIPNVTDLDQAV